MRGGSFRLTVRPAGSLPVRQALSQPQAGTSQEKNTCTMRVLSLLPPSSAATRQAGQPPLIASLSTHPESRVCAEGRSWGAAAEVVAAVGERGEGQGSRIPLLKVLPKRLHSDLIVGKASAEDFTIEYLFRPNIFWFSAHAGVHRVHAV